jgi:hypothetical protein
MVPLQCQNGEARAEMAGTPAYKVFSRAYFLRSFRFGVLIPSRKPGEKKARSQCLRDATLGGASTTNIQIEEKRWL